MENVYKNKPTRIETKRTRLGKEPTCIDKEQPKDIENSQHV